MHSIEVKTANCRRPLCTDVKVKWEKVSVSISVVYNVKTFHPSISSYLMNHGT